MYDGMIVTLVRQLSGAETAGFEAIIEMLNTDVTLYKGIASLLSGTVEIEPLFDIGESDVYRVTAWVRRLTSLRLNSVQCS